MIKKFKQIITLVIILSLAAWVFYTYQITASAGQSKDQVNFIIEQGQGVNQISQNLYNAGLIRNKFYFEVYAWLKKIEHRFVAGSHKLSPSLNIIEVTERLTSHSGESEAQITIIEGWNNQEIAEYLEKKELVEKNDFLNLISHNLGDFIKDYDFLKDKPDNVDLEGFLFPDTYRVYGNATDEEIVRKLLDNFDKKLTQKMREDIKLQNKTIFEIITLASIIEKEVPNPADMKMIADIFYKRLEAGIALQSDATVNYITGKGHVQPTYDDTRIDNLYNTYMYRGLPPGPISNPGLSAIEAAIYPESNPYYYFLTKLDTGEVIYSKTYDEHLANKAKYLN